LITPPNFAGGGGSCLPLMVVVALGEPGAPPAWTGPGVAHKTLAVAKTLPTTTQVRALVAASCCFMSSSFLSD
jgi:hypothetical protein